MAEQKMFTIEAMPETQFRAAYTSPVDLLALSTQVDFDQFEKTKELFTFALEHCEVQIGKQWEPVKYPGREVYLPMGIADNYQALLQICNWYMENILRPVFPDSAE